jgi:vitamin B12 transporter
LSPCGRAWRSAVMKKILALSMAAALPVAMPRAETLNLPDTPMAGNTVVVTASRSPETSFDTLAYATVIDRAEIESTLAVDIADILGREAGIDVARTGGPGQQTAIFMRGANSNHTVLLIDGVRINPGTIGVAAVQNIAPELVDHIEIVRGPRSSIYGSDAIGGVINVVMRDPHTSGGDVAAHYGQFNTRNATGDAHFADGTSSIMAAVNWLESTGYPMEVGDTTDRGYRNLSFTLAGHTRLGTVDLAAHAWRSSGDVQYSTLDYSNFPTPAGVLPADERYVTSMTSAEAGSSLTPSLKTHFLVSEVTDDIRQTIGSSDYETTHRRTVDWQNDWATGIHAVTFGAIIESQHTVSSVYGSGFDASTHRDQYYAQDRVASGRNRITAAFGYVQDGLFGGHSTWNAAYGFEIDRDTIISASVGTAFRAPDTTDLYGFGGNALLRPETSRNIEMDLKHRIGTQQLVTLALYDNRITNLIEYAPMPTPDDPYNGINENVGHARSRGMDAAWDYSGKQWRAHLSVNLQDPKDLDTGELLLRRSRASGKLTVDRSLSTLQELGMDVVAIGRRADIDNFFGTPLADGAYTLVGVRWRGSLARGWTFEARIDNLLDHAYQTANGYPGPRRGLYGGFRYAFD